MPLAKFLLMAAGALLLASTALGFMNMNRLKATQTAKVEAEQRAKANADRADKTARELKALQGQLEAANKTSADLQNKLTPATQEAAAAKSAADESAAKVAALMAELDQFKASAPKTPSAPATPDTNVEKDNKIRDLEAQLAEARQVQQTLTNQAKVAADTARELRKKEDLRQRGLMTSGLSGTIRAVDLNWNFVVLDLGDRQGVVNGGEMIVTRGGNVVGKVRITSVEPSQSIADIVPNSVPPGITVQRGDRVIYAGGEPVRR